MAEFDIDFGLDRGYMERTNRSLKLGSLPYCATLSVLVYNSSVRSFLVTHEPFLRSTNSFTNIANIAIGRIANIGVPDSKARPVFGSLRIKHACAYNFFQTISAPKV